jgi:hypothetical protein
LLPEEEEEDSGRSVPIDLPNPWATVTICLVAADGGSRREQGWAAEVVGVDLQAVEEESTEDRASGEGRAKWRGCKILAKL